MITVNDMDQYNSAVTNINQKILREYQKEIANTDTVHSKGEVIKSQIERLFSVLDDTHSVLVEVRAT